MRYRIVFSAVLKGALNPIGPLRRETVEADSPEEALLKLYDTYDHIHLPTIIPLGPPAETSTPGGS